MAALTWWFMHLAGVACALVGMARTAHVRDNVDLLETPPASADDVRSLFDEDA